MYNLVDYCYYSFFNACMNFNALMCRHKNVYVLQYILQITVIDASFFYKLTNILFPNKK